MGGGVLGEDLAEWAGGPRLFFLSAGRVDIEKEGYTRPSTLGCLRPTGRPPLPSP